jgi:adenylate kinase
MNLVLFGPPGSGKGTQAERLRDAMRLRHISTGDLLRDAVARGTDLGRQVQGILASGQLVSDDLVLALMRDAIVAVGEEASLTGWLLDGFPRTVGQAEGLDRMLMELRQEIGGIVVLDVRREAVVARLSGRRTCTKCKAVYHVSANPPKQEGICDRCGGALVQREDDRAETIARRLDVYEAQTQPIIAHYRARVPLYEIDGEQPVDEVTRSIARVLK